MSSAAKAVSRKSGAGDHVVSPPHVSEAGVGEPPVALVADQSDAGKAAADLLTSAGIPFRRIAPQAPGQVGAEFGGLWFEGAEGVRQLACALSKMEEVFLRKVRQAYPHLFHK